MKQLVFTLALAYTLWAVMFSPWTAPHISFWVMMTISASILCIISSCFNPKWGKKIHLTPKNILMGLALAAVMWGVFWLGDKISAWMFSFARPQVDTIYDMKEGQSAGLLTFLMLVLIGPAEEIYWRGYVQETLTRKFSPNVGFVVATLLYALAHVASFNFMLIMAAMVAGAIWGLVYRFFPNRLDVLIVSHAVWDVAVFIWFPI